MASEDAVPVSSVIRPTFTVVAVTPGALAVLPAEALPAEPVVPSPEGVLFEELLQAAKEPMTSSTATPFPMRRFISLVPPT
jgi:hypothetical protein